MRLQRMEKSWTSRFAGCGVVDPTEAPRPDVDPAAGASPGRGNLGSWDRGGEPAVAGVERRPLGLGS
jgi:hypothetical protein